MPELPRYSLPRQLHVSSTDKFSEVVSGQPGSSYPREPSSLIAWLARSSIGQLNLMTRSFRSAPHSKIKNFPPSLSAVLLHHFYSSNHERNKVTEVRTTMTRISPTFDLWSKVPSIRVRADASAIENTLNSNSKTYLAYKMLFASWMSMTRDT